MSAEDEGVRRLRHVGRSALMVRVQGWIRVTGGRTEAHRDSAAAECWGGALVVSVSCG